MFTPRKSESTEIISVGTKERRVEELLTKEWLLTNERGGYASSTIVGCHTRRYHGLLIGSVNPLANRIAGLSNCLEMVIVKGASSVSAAAGCKGADTKAGANNPENGKGGTVFNLSTFEFMGKFAPAGFKYMKRFRRDTGVHFDYDLDGLKLTKSVYLAHGADTVALVYDFSDVGGSVLGKGCRSPKLGGSIEFILRPFIGLRDFHILQKSYARFRTARFGDSLWIRHSAGDSCELLLSCSSMDFRKDPQWWFNFIYRNDKERGQDYSEDLWSPGFFKWILDSPSRIVLWASLRGSDSRSRVVRQKDREMGAEEDAEAGDLSDGREGEFAVGGLVADIEGVCGGLRRHHEGIERRAKSAKRGMRRAMRDSRHRILCLAADQFIARCRTNGVVGRNEEVPALGDEKHRSTILAGFPWFADWGRDTFISLPGLLLLTARFEEAKSVLTRFAEAVDEGMIPNRFDDYSETAYFNSIDASLWFVSASFQYLYATGDSETFARLILPTIHRIIDSYENGTRFGIHTDTDGLITGGNSDTQLTWMDGKCEGIAFTPRHGKAVEINALWYNSLCHLARYYGRSDREASRDYKSMSEQVGSSFCRSFWNERVGYLNDCILPDGSVDSSLRPNQIFAVSLPFTALSAGHARCVVDVVERHLLTPYGLRTLNVEDARYRGRYTGPARERDEAYHQGTVWAFLIGPFVEAYLKVNNYSRKSKRRAAEFIRPLLEHLVEDGCLGQVCEIFDGDTPHNPKGCFAQAWSVAELIRAYHLINC